MARPVDIPPGSPAAPCPLDVWRTRRYLRRLARQLRRRGWTAQTRFTVSPPLLRVYDPQTPHIEDHVTVVREDAGFWFVSSSGKWLAPCADLDWAVARVSAQLVHRINTAI